MINKAQLNDKKIIAAPARKALTFFFTFTSLSILYIFLSDLVFSKLSTDMTQYFWHEVAKGTAYSVIVGSAFSILIFKWLKKKKELEDELHASYARLMKAERRETAHLCSITLAHDLNNLLTIQNMLLEAVESQPSLEPSLSASVGDMRAFCDRLSKMARRITSASTNQHHSQMETIPLGNFVHETVRMLRKHRDLEGVTVDINTGPELRIRMDPTQFSDLVTNMLINSAQAVGPGGQIEIRAFQDEFVYVIEFHDDGPGVPSHLREQIFDPAFTTKKNGSGLGLLAVKQFLQAHEGWIEVGDSPRGGACFIIRMPLPSEKPSGRSERIKRITQLTG